MNIFITGTLGSGKSLAAIYQIQKALTEGRRVATNLNIKPEKLVGINNKMHINRLSDFPTLHELEALGTGADVMNEKQFGLLVIDEASIWLNNRQWQSKDQGEVIKWLRHARKKRWNCLFISQDEASLDKQVRLALIEYTAACMRLDRFMIPFIGRIIKVATGIEVKFPRIHIAIVRYRTRNTDYFVERWWYNGSTLYNAYDTEQAFTGDTPPHTVLSNWYTTGQHIPQIDWQLLVKTFWFRWLPALGGHPYIPRKQTAKPLTKRAVRARVIEASCPESGCYINFRPA